MEYAGYLGGELGTGVNHIAWEAGGESYEAVMPVEQAKELTLYQVMAAGVPMVLFRQGERISATSATCSHAGGPLDEGARSLDMVECPWRGSRFRLCDERILTGPATVNAPRYEVRVRNGQVEIKRTSSVQWKQKGRASDAKQHDFWKQSTGASRQATTDSAARRDCRRGVRWPGSGQSITPRACPGHGD